jgi:sugar phosphate permease
MATAAALSPSRWYRLMPVFFVTYSLAFLDRVNFGFGLAGGMAKDLHITNQSVSLVSAFFFLGYFLFQVPGAWYAHHKSAKKLIFWSLVLWGLLSSATGLIRNIPILLIDRFLLGVVESAVLPSILIMMSRWFVQTERSRVNTFLLFGNPLTLVWMSVLSGYLIYSLGWRGMFVWEGIPAMLWALYWWFAMKDRPQEATWLTPDEKENLKAALHSEQRGIRPVKNYLAAFRSRPVILLGLQYFLWSVVVYGIVIWLPSMIRAAPAIGIVQTGWLSSLPYLLAMGCMYLAASYSDKRLKRKAYIWPFLMAGAVFLLGAYLAGTERFWLSYALLVLAGVAIYTPYGPFFALIAEILPENVSGGSIALINSLGALGGFAGSWLVGYLNKGAGGFGVSFLLMSGAAFLSALVTLIAVPERPKP